MQCEISENDTMNVSRRLSHSRLGPLLCRQLECFCTMDFILFPGCSGSPTSNHWWQCMTESYCPYICNFWGWSLRWPFCQFSVGRIAAHFVVVETFMDSVPNYEGLSAASNCCRDTSQSTHTILLMSLTNMFSVEGSPLFVFIHDTHPTICSCSTISALVGWQKICAVHSHSLWMFMGSMFCANRNWVIVCTSSLVNSFSKVAILQLTLCQHCISCTVDDTCFLVVGAHTNLQRLLVSQKQNRGTYFLT
jgi:hypothetical protein